MKPQRTTIRFSLLALLGMVTLIAGYFAYVTFMFKLHPVEAACDQLHDLGAYVTPLRPTETGEVYYQLELSEDWHGEPRDLLYLEAIDRIGIVRMHTTPRTDEDLEVLARLDNVSQNAVELSLVDSAVTDEGLRHVVGWPSLLIVDLSGTTLAGDGLRHLSRSPKLRVLRLNRARFTDPSIPGLAALNQVQELSIRDTNITDAALASLAKMTSLRTLDLTSSPSIDGSGLAELKSLRNLELLRLRESNVRGEFILVLAELPKLQEVSLDRTQVTPEQANGLRRARPGLLVGE